MEEKNLIQIKFGSFLKIYTTASFSLGVIFGALAFVLSLFGGEVTATLGSAQMTGITAGLVNIFLFPVIAALGGVVFALLAFWPFVLFLKIVKGMKIKVKFD